MREVVISAVSWLLAIGAAADTRSLHDGAVSIAIPDNWREQLDEPRGDDHVLMYEVPFAETAGTPHIAQVVLTTKTNPNFVSVSDYALWSLRSDLAKPGFAILSSSADSESWLTTLSTGGDQGVRYAVIDRFSASSNRLAHLRIAFPILKGAPNAWYRDAIRRFNALLRSFSLAGSSPNSSKLLLSDGVLGLGSATPGKLLDPPSVATLNSPFHEPGRGLILYIETPSSTPAAQRGVEPDAE